MPIVRAGLAPRNIALLNIASMNYRFATVVLWLLATGALRAEDDFFRQNVAPILQKHCLSCHNEHQKKGELSLISADALLEGGESGDAIAPGDVDSSYLIEVITPEDGEASMPEGQKPLTQAERDILHQWVADGAHWPKGLVLEEPLWWSLRPLVRPSLPVDAEGKPLNEDPWVRNPIDTFILQKLTEKGLRPSAEADRKTLIRRLYYDLVGLPPPPEEVDQFVADPDPEAYEKLVDRLLDSPRYGERWARHWLDVVHYGETHGYDKDKLRLNAWPYRDYVIRALNEDKRYTQFMQEQIAGDVLFPDGADGIEALGFISAGPWDHVGHAEVPETKIDGKVARHLDRDDMVRNTIMTFMSLTIGCAQCHEHKFDPISQEEYYSLQAVFAALDRAETQYYDDPQLTQQRQSLRRRGRTLQRREYKLKKALKLDEKESTEENSEEAPEETIVEKPEEKRAKETADKIAAKTEEKGEPQAIEADASAAPDPEEQKELAAKKKEFEEVTSELKEILSELGKLPEPKIAYIGTVHYGAGTFLGTGYQGGQPRKIHILNRGSVTSPGKEVQPGALGCIEGLNPRFDVAEDAPEGERRKALATWISDLRNPLPWRSIVNRLWQYHFGRGIIETPNDFGRMGAPPSHLELLNYLAAEFRDHDQSLKQLHRQMVTSATYRQASVAEPEQTQQAQKIDADNRLLWRMNRRRLEAEALRDAVLQVSGKLDLTMGGPSFQDFVIDKPEHSPHYQYHRHDPEDPKSHRRSIYRFIVRSQTQPFLTVMDCADPSMLVAKRNETISPLQSLALLNNQLAVVMSKHFAERAATMGENLKEQIAAAFRLALSRPPNEAELTALSRYADRHGLANTCRVIYNLNEFSFVD